VAEAVRASVTVDWDAGHALVKRQPLPDVQPGETYDEECFPSRPIRVREILLSEGFDLVSVTTHQHGCISPGKPVGREDGGLLYSGVRWIDGIPVAVNESIRFSLRNLSDRPLKVKKATIVSLSEMPFISRRCPICGSAPGISCRLPCGAWRGLEAPTVTWTREDFLRTPCPTCKAASGEGCSSLRVKTTTGDHDAEWHEDRRPWKPGEWRACGIPSGTLGPCDLPWGHVGHMHASAGDGFGNAKLDEEHTRRQAVVAAALGSRTDRRQELEARRNLEPDYGAVEAGRFGRSRSVVDTFIDDRLAAMRERPQMWATSKVSFGFLVVQLVELAMLHLPAIAVREHLAALRERVFGKGALMRDARLDDSTEGWCIQAVGVARATLQELGLRDRDDLLG